MRRNAHFAKQGAEVVGQCLAVAHPLLHHVIDGHRLIAADTQLDADISRIFAHELTQHAHLASVGSAGVGQGMHLLSDGFGQDVTPLLEVIDPFAEGFPVGHVAGIAFHRERKWRKDDGGHLLVQILGIGVALHRRQVLQLEFGNLLAPFLTCHDFGFEVACMPS